MRSFSKVFFFSLLLFLLALFVGSYSYIKENNINMENVGYSKDFYKKVDLTRTITKPLETKEKKPIIYSSFSEAIKESNRINFLILGLEDIRSDTIIFASFCPDSKKVSLINIPRDTYIHRKGYDSAEQRKINSIYGDHGILGVKKTVSYIFKDVPIHHYILLDYEGVEKIVDAIGGVEVDVPFPMRYKDPYSKPPLNIDIKPGKQLLDGKKSLEFLRYRKGNSTKDGYIDGDLGRIKAQQSFLTSFIDIVSSNLLTAITKGFSHVKTDINLLETMSYGRKALGMGKDDFEIITLPGKAEFRRYNNKVLSYFIYDKDETQKLMEKLYNVIKN